MQERRLYRSGRYCINYITRNSGCWYIYILSCMMKHFGNICNTSTFNSEFVIQYLLDQVASIPSARASPKRDPILPLATHVSAMLEKGGLGGAVRLMCSDDTLAPINESTLLPCRTNTPFHTLTLSYHVFSHLCGDRRRNHPSSLLFCQMVLPEVLMALDLST